jgi:hypothetical protein
MAGGEFSWRTDIDYLRAFLQERRDSQPCAQCTKHPPGDEGDNQAR